MDAVMGFAVAPGQCFTCGSSDGQLWAINTRREAPPEISLKRLNIYICAPCVRAAAKMLEPHVGWQVITSDDLAPLYAAKGLVAELERRAERAESLLRSLAELLPTEPDGVPA